MGFLRNIYLYVVSFVALMITITAVITAFNAISDIIIPESEVYNYGYTTYDDYTLEGEGIGPKVSEEQINKQKEAEIRGAQKNLINSVGAMIIGGATYWFHWRAIEKEHKFFKIDNAVKPENKIV